MQATTYSYQTLPGQTIVRTACDGYSFEDLCREVRLNGEGVVVTTDEGRTDDKLESIAGREAKSL